ncbi:MAG TPA: hypothetical protein VK002_02615, partial [Rubricoccaceae bacterium]|nr:hypothetical protein [Rubricoccaceae bacterium]
MSNAIRCVLLGTLAFLLAPGLAAQDTLRVTQVVVEGETVTLPGGGTGTVSTIQTSLFTNRNAEVGFSVDVQGDDGVWFGDAPIWLNSQATSHTLTGAEFTMGIGDNGEFIYSPSIDGNDGVWTDQGYLLADGDPAPGFEGDTLVTFNSRPTMGANGTAYWVAGVNDGAGGTSTVNRALYMSTDRTPATTSVVLRSGDIVGGFPLAGGSDGIGFNYEFSDDGTHHILGLVLETGSSTDDNVVYVDGAIVAREAHPNGSGIDNWDNFDIHRILDDGTYGFTGDTDGSTATDEFIAINGTIVLREGDVVDGVTLGSGVVAFDLNADGLVVFGWSLTSSSDEGLFVADISDIPGTARLVARTNDLLDTDGDGTPEWVLTDVNPSASTGQGAGALAPDGTFFISLGVEPVGGGTEVDGAFAFDFGGGDECEQDLTATLDDPNPAPGDVMTFAVTVTNNSPDPAPLDLWLVATGPANKTVRLGGGTLPG